MSRLNSPVSNFALTPVLCFVLVISCFSMACDSGDSSSETDREALAALYHATNGPNWLRNSNWLTDAPLEDWYGVSTDEDGRVTRLELPGNELRGSIPPELGNLDRLRVLELTANRTITHVSIEIGVGESKSADDLVKDLPQNPTDKEREELFNKLAESFDRRDPVKRAIDDVAEQASDPQNTVVERNHLSGCIPSSLKVQLDLETSDLGELPFCDEDAS